MMFATVASGVLMMLVHGLAKKMPGAEYGVSGTLLQLLAWLTIPSIGLQMVFAHQTAASVTEEQERQLRGTFRAVILAGLGLWVLVLGIVALNQQAILTTLKIANPAGLWVTMMCGLFMLWLPVCLGVLQGRQNFFWVGWAQIFNGSGRLVFAAIAVLIFQAHAAGFMIGALLGLVVAFIACMWQVRQLWQGTTARVDWKTWLSTVVPLTFGLGASQFQTNADVIVVQANFPGDETGAYVAVGTLCRALVAFTAPLAAVMFPILVRSVAKSESSNALKLTLIGTAVLGGIGAIGLSVFAPWLLKLVKPEFLVMTPIIAWFAWGMLPLALANVLINHLLAHKRYAVVPWLVAVAVGYWFTINHYHDSYLTVVKAIGGFNLLMLLVASGFAWFSRSEKAA